MGVKVMSLAAAIVLIGYVVAEIAGADLGSAAVTLRIVIVVSAAVVAVMAYSTWSHGNTSHTLSAMILGLLGGASTASAVSTAKGDEVYGSAPMALVGTLAVVAAVTIAQIAQTRAKEKSR